MFLHMMICLIVDLSVCAEVHICVKILAYAYFNNTEKLANTTDIHMHVCSACLCKPYSFALPEIHTGQGDLGVR